MNSISSQYVTDETLIQRIRQLRINKNDFTFVKKLAKGQFGEVNLQIKSCLYRLLNSTSGFIGSRKTGSKDLRNEDSSKNGHDETGRRIK